MKFSKLRIAIVDDNKDFSEILGLYLSNFDDFEIVGYAKDGVDAIELIKETTPDLVLMDMVMPKLDGIDVLNYFKSLNCEKKPQFIIISAVGQDACVQLALQLGALFYIIKPCDLTEIVRKLRLLKPIDSKNTDSNFYCNINEDIKEIKSDNLKSMDENVNLKVKNLLDKIGIPSHLKGYEYLIHAITLVEEDLTAINSLTKVIYMNVASKYKTTISRVEKAIRNAIEIAWSKGNFNCINSPFVSKLTQKPTNSEFITMIIDHFRK